MSQRFQSRISDGNSSTTPLAVSGSLVPTFRAATSNGGGGPSLTIAKPAGVVAGDVMVAFVNILNVDGDMTAPADWILIRNDVQDGLLLQTDVNCFAYWKRAGGAEPADYTWTFSATANMVGAIAAYQNIVTAGVPVNGDSGAVEFPSNESMVVAPSVAGTTAGSRLVAYFAHTQPGHTFTPPPGMTERVDFQGGGHSTSLADQVFGAGGNTGSRTATMALPSSGAHIAQTNVAQMVVLTPAVAGGGSTFFGSAEEVLDYSGIRVVAESDRFSTVAIQFSTDGANWRTTDEFTTVNGRFDPAGETFRSEIVPVRARFVRVNLQNNVTAAQTFLRLQTILLPEADQPLNRTPERFRVHNGIATVAAGATGTVVTVSGDEAQRALEVFAYGATQSPGADVFTFQQVLLRTSTAMHRRAVRNQVGDHWTHVRFETRGEDLELRVTNNDVISHSFIGFIQVREP